MLCPLPFWIGIISLRSARFMFFFRKTLFDGADEQEFVSCLDRALSPSAFQFPTQSFDGLFSQADSESRDAMPREAEDARSSCPCLNLEPRECPLHSCKCKACRPRSDRDELMTCKWKLRHRQWIAASRLTSVGPLPDKMMRIISGYASPRQRHMLALLYAKFKDRLLEGGALDVSQSIQFCQARVDGRLGSFATTSDVLHFGLERELSLKEMAILMGFSQQTAEKLAELGLRQRALARKLVGNAIHVACLGVALTGLLTVKEARVLPRA